MKQLIYEPHYTITDKILTLVAQIATSVDAAAANTDMEENPKLRRANRIHTIYSSLVIENNSLSLEQVTGIIEGKRVLATPQDICVVENAFQAYRRLFEFNPYYIMDLLTLHQVLMKDLVKYPGLFRNDNVSVFHSKEIVHIAPPADNVSGLVANLIQWTKEAAVHPLVKSCVFHYELGFIHPFSDGNGRIGRMWQTLLLYQWKDIFAWLPLESMVRERQTEYYSTRRCSNDADDCTDFICFMLQLILDTLEIYSTCEQDIGQVSDHVRQLLDVLGTKTLSTTELMSLLNLKHRPTFRSNYLHPALDQHLIEMTLPNAPTSRHQQYRKNTNM
ncbi:MAG: Fic family protein [Oscillospiraceae bacterium]|nr:Fic family protein [Oscillospiraceae bacterium]